METDEGILACAVTLKAATTYFGTASPIIAYAMNDLMETPFSLCRFSQVKQKSARGPPVDDVRCLHTL
jgi:hypothetical protein